MEKIRTIPAKTIVTKNKNPDFWFGHDYNMNLYKGCSHGCIYCDSRSECYHVENFDEVRVKENALKIVDRELKSKVKTGVVATGAMSDPYNPLERELKLTRQALERINAYGFGAAIATKSDLITRDMDILKEINVHSPVCLKLTVTTLDDALCRKVEQQVVPSSVRLAAVEKLAAAGLFCGVLLMPVLPFINDSEENIAGIVHAAADAGAKFVYSYMGVTMRQNQRDHFYRKLEKDFPGLAAKYRSAYSEKYECGVPGAERLHRVLAEACGSRGLLHRMPDIIAAYKVQKSYRQMTLF